MSNKASPKDPSATKKSYEKPWRVGVKAAKSPESENASESRIPRPRSAAAAPRERSAERSASPPNTNPVPQSGSGSGTKNKIPLRRPLTARERSTSPGHNLDAIAPASADTVRSTTPTARTKKKIDSTDADLVNRLRDLEDLVIKQSEHIEALTEKLRISDTNLQEVQEREREASKSLTETTRQNEDSVVDGLNQIATLVTAQHSMQNEIESASLSASRISKELRWVLVEALAVKRAAAMFASAPGPTGMMGIVTARVSGTRTLWSLFPDVCASSLALCVTSMREEIRESRGYECRSDAAGVSLVFQDSLDAIHFCVRLQSKLLSLPWAPQITDHFPEINGRSGRRIWRGLRVKMGVHIGTPVRREVAGGIEYTGRDVEKSKQLCRLASGGQIILSAAARLACIDRLQQIGDTPTLSYVGDLPLKGIVAREEVFQLLPDSLSERASSFRYDENDGNDSDDDADFTDKISLINTQVTSLQAELKKCGFLLVSYRESASSIKGRLQDALANFATLSPEAIAIALRRVDELESHESSIEIRLAEVERQRQRLESQMARVQEDLALSKAREESEAESEVQDLLLEYRRKMNVVGDMHKQMLDKLSTFKIAA